MAQAIAQIIFIRDNKILLGFRQNTKAYNLLWGFPAGRIEAGESPLDCARRESLEELSVQPIQLEPLTDLIDPQTGAEHHFYTCTSWQGEAHNAEPHLCREIAWFDRVHLPPDCTPLTYPAIQALQKLRPINPFDRG